MKQEELKRDQPVKVRMTGREGKVTGLWADGSVSVKLPGGMTVTCMPHDLDPVKGGAPA